MYTTELQHKFTCKAQKHTLGKLREHSVSTRCAIAICSSGMPCRKYSVIGISYLTNTFPGTRSRQIQLTHSWITKCLCLMVLLQAACRVRPEYHFLAFVSCFLFQQLFRSTRTRWNTFFRPFVHSFKLTCFAAKFIWIPYHFNLHKLGDQKSLLNSIFS